MRLYRQGYRLMWKACPKYLRSFGLGKPGSFDADNQHGGVMPALPHEMKLITDARVRRITSRCAYSGKMTIAELKVVRKTFSFVYQTQGKGSSKDNFPCMRSTWDDLDADALKATFRPLKPTKMPSADVLKRAFTKPWSPDCGVPLLIWSRNLLAAYDTFLNGHRPNVDTGKVKHDSETDQEAQHRHLFDLAEGWQSTSMHGGRAKLTGLRKGRPWRSYKVCHCPGDRHTPLPVDKDGTCILYYSRKDGNVNDMTTGELLTQPTWTTECPVAAAELVLGSQYNLDPKKRGLFKLWNKKNCQFGVRNVGNVANLALQFLKDQADEKLDETEYDRHGGRKVLGRICDALQIPYHESFQVHGDLPSTWSDKYQFNMAPTEYTKREQADNAIACIACGRRVAQWLGRGVPLKPKLGLTQRMLRGLYNMMGKSAMVNQIIAGLDEDSLPQKRESPKPEPLKEEPSLYDHRVRKKRPRESSDEEDSLE